MIHGQFIVIDISFQIEFFLKYKYWVFCLFTNYLYSIPVNCSNATCLNKVKSNKNNLLYKW